MNWRDDTCDCAYSADTPERITAECHVPCSPPPRPGYFFAPGTIQFTSRRRWLSNARVDSIARALLTAAALCALAAAIGFSVGWLEVRGWLL